MICPKCGKKFKEGSKFCPVCGTALMSEKDSKGKTVMPSARMVVIALVIVIVVLGGLLIATLSHKNAENNSSPSMAETSDLSDSSSSSMAETSDLSDSSTADSTQTSMSKSETLAKKFTDDDYVVYTDSQTGENSYYGLFKKKDIDFDGCETTADYYIKIEKHCEERGGHLAIIDSEDKNMFLYDWVVDSTEHDTAMFGLSDCVKESYNDPDGFKWIDGKEHSYSNWSNSVSGKEQPNNNSWGKKKDGDQDFVVFYTNSDAEPGSWNDVGFKETAEKATNVEWTRFICEWDD